jgi:hypothetical protein
VLEESVLAEHVALAVVIAARRGAGRVSIRPVGGVWIDGLGGRPGRMCGGSGSVGQRVGVLGGGGVVRAAAEQFGARCGSLLVFVSLRYLGAMHATHQVLVGAQDALEAGAVLVQLAAEVLQAVIGLVLLDLHRLLLGELAVVVDSARKRRERCIELRLQVRRGRLRVRELVQVLANRRRLAQRRVEEGVL